MKMLLSSGFGAQTPEIILLVTAILIVFLDSFTKDRFRRELGAFALAGTFLAFAAAILQARFLLSMRQGSTIFSGMAMNDGVASVARLIVLFTLLIGLMLGYAGARQRKHSGEFHALILFASLGALILANAGHLIALVLGLEILSLPLYTLAAFDYRRRAAREAGLKYLILGAFSSGFLAFGCALYYAGAGTFSIDLVNVAPEGRLIFSVGGALILGGLMFKGGILPFFAWSPDAYEGAPDFAVGLMAALAKTATFIILMRLLPALLPAIQSSALMPGLTLIAAGTMLAGNLLALVQSNLKRMLAYSAISHAGYLFTGLLAFRMEASSGVLFYLAVYAPVLVASFQIVSLFPGDEGGHELKDYSGLARRSPVIATLFALMLISLAGIPPAGGFIGKVITFMGAVQGGLVYLVILAMLTSLIGVYYYFRVIAYMFMHEPPENESIPSPDLGEAGILGKAGYWIVGFVIVLLGVFPAPLLYLTVLAVRHLARLASPF